MGVEAAAGAGVYAAAVSAVTGAAWLTLASPAPPLLLAAGAWVDPNALSPNCEVCEPVADN